MIKNYKRKKKTTSKLQCVECKYVFSNFLDTCPECGSEKITDYSEVNPYSRMPLESVLKSCGHIMWLGGTFLFLFFLWNTNSPDEVENMRMIRYAILSLFVGVLCSVLYIGLSEVIHRILRVQRRLKAFHENHHPNLSENTKEKTKNYDKLLENNKIFKKRNTLMQYGMSTNKRKSVKKLKHS